MVDGWWVADVHLGQQDRRPPFAHLISRFDRFSVLIFAPWLLPHYIDDDFQRQTTTRWAPEPLFSPIQKSMLRRMSRPGCNQ